MSVEYHASTVSNMDMDNSKIGYKQLLMEGCKFQHSVYVLRNSPFRIATVCLGLLCLILLLGIIGQSVHYRKIDQEQQNNLNVLKKDKDSLQQDLGSAYKQKKDLETAHNNLRQRNDYLTQRNGQLTTNYNLLTTESEKVKQSERELKASNNALTKETETLKNNNDQLQTANDALTTAKDLLQKQYDVVLKGKTELQAHYNSVTRERDNLQNRYNNVTRQKDQLQSDYNILIKDVEHLQDSYNYSVSEKDKLASSHQNLTITKETLQANYNVLAKATDELRGSYRSLIQEKKDLEDSCKNVTLERDQLLTQNDNLTAERGELQVEIAKLKAKLQDRRCPTGWRKFEGSCYYTSTGKKAWRQGREYCQSKGADLAIVKTQEEMAFINSLYPSDKEVWIGLTDEGIEGNWKWVDGTPLTTTFWGKDQPNSFDGRNQDCVEFWHRATGNGDWNDENCNVEQNWICEM